MRHSGGSIVKKLASVALLLAVASLATGCAAFPAGKTADAQVPSVAGKAYKPSAYLDIKFFHGKPGSSGVTEIPAARAEAQAAVERVLSTSSPFSRHTFDAFEQDKVDHVVRLYYYNHGEVGGAAILGAICGFTFGVIPAAATDKYTLVSKVDKPKGGAERNSDDQVTTWMGIWFLPMSSKTPQKAVASTLESMTRDGLRQLIESNQLSFDAPGPVATPPAQPTTTPTATPGT